MSTRSLLLGSYDLKRTYQKNMAIGFGLSGAAHVLIILALVLFMSASRKPVKAPEYVIKSKADLIAPPSLSQQQAINRIATPQQQAKPANAVPMPVPDEEAPEETEVMNQQQLADLAPSAPVENLDANINVDVDKVVNELLPSPDEFVPFEEAPVQVTTVQPKYPPLAQRAGVEGAVWVKALVDKEGKVRDVLIVKDSGANAGFEEAAIEAAKATVWKPAISNGQPVAVWVTYKVDFKLK